MKRNATRVVIISPFVFCSLQMYTAVSGQKKITLSKRPARPNSAKIDFRRAKPGVNAALA
jgi:hypothetical protein